MKNQKNTIIGLAFLSLILLIVSITQYRKNNILKEERIVKIDSIATRVEGLTIKYKRIDSLPVNRTAYLDLYDKYIEQKNESIKLRESIKETKDEWYVSIFKLWGTIGAILGVFIAFFGLPELIKKVVINKIADITGNSTEVIKENYNQFIKHNKLKKEVNILVLNEKGTDFPESFTKVMKLFAVNPTKKKYRIDINGLSKAISKKNLKRMRKADIVIIEDQQNNILNQKDKKSNWKFGDTRNLKKNDIIDKSINDESYKNVLYLIELADKICDTTAILYYGQGNFPSQFVKPENQTLVSFAKAPSQLYGNLLNMIKFKNELENG